MNNIKNIDYVMAKYDNREYTSKDIIKLFCPREFKLQEIDNCHDYNCNECWNLEIEDKI